MKLNRNASIITAAVALLLLTAGSASAVLVSELGILNLSANGGINPATGQPWQAGDKFRLAFVTSTTSTATSTNINDYNAFVQSVANGSSLGLGSATWKVIGSTDAVDARTNTGTPTNLPGEATFLMDGSTVFATSYADLWNGSPFVSSVVVGTTTTNLFLAPHFNEEGVSMNSLAANGTTLGVRVFTGTNGGLNTANRQLGEAGGVTETGLTNPNNNSRWLIQFNNTQTSPLRFFALSDPLTIREATTIPEPATASLALIGLGGLMMRRRRQTLA